MRIKHNSNIIVYHKIKRQAFKMNFYNSIIQNPLQDKRAIYSKSKRNTQYHL